MAAFLQFLILFSIPISILATCFDGECNYGTPQYTNDTLADKFGPVIFVSAICRHGSRTPIYFAPNDKYQNQTYQNKCWPEGPGQLTQEGKCQAEEAGSWARARYGNISRCQLPYRYDHSEMISSNVDRTTVSCQLISIGLHHTLVELRVFCGKSDNMIEFNAVCNNYAREKQKLHNNTEMLQIWDQNKHCFETAGNHTGWNMSRANAVSAFDYLYYWYDSKLSQLKCNLTLEPWEKDILECAKCMAAQALANRVRTDQMKRLRAGAILYKILTEMYLITQGKLLDPLCYHFYCGHDLTIVTILRALGIFNDLIPPLSSCLFIELRKKNDDYFVTVLYRNSTTSPPHHFEIPGCSENCTLDNYKNATANVTTENWSQECGNDDICDCID